MDLRISGKRALVTGSSSGIGAACALQLAAEGVKVVVHGRDATRAEAIAAQIRSAGGTAHVALGDLASDAGADQVAAEAAGAWGGIDILVNNAGGPSSMSVSWDSNSSDDWSRTFELNTLSAVRMIRHVAPGMKAAGWGRIVQVSSMASVRSRSPAIPDYGAAKATINQISFSASRWLANTGITVNTVSPGLIVSTVLKEFFLALPENAGRSWEEVEQTLAASWGGTVGRIGNPDDVAAAIVFLTSPLADHINGTNVRIDGGMTGYVN